MSGTFTESWQKIHAGNRKGRSRQWFIRRQTCSWLWSRSSWPCLRVTGTRWSLSAERLISLYKRALKKKEDIHAMFISTHTKTNLHCIYAKITLYIHFKCCLISCSIKQLLSESLLLMHLHVFCPRGIFFTPMNSSNMTRIAKLLSLGATDHWTNESNSCASLQ